MTDEEAAGGGDGANQDTEIVFDDRATAQDELGRLIETYRELDPVGRRIVRLMYGRDNRFGWWLYVKWYSFTQFVSVLLQAMRSKKQP